jgi:CHAD domain-containing protein
VVIAERWEHVWQATPVAIEGSDPEGVHDVRVASRRLRAAMDVAADAFPAEWYRPLHKLAKQITRELGAVRDRDVLIASFEKERAAAPPEEWPGIDLVITRIEHERIEARQHMERFLKSLEETGAIKESRRRFGDGDKKRVKSDDAKEARS